MITLGLIKRDITKWNTFVANRVAQIQKLTPPDCWKHVKTDENPADAISRGMEPEGLERSKMWWSGPSWLQEQQQFTTIEIKLVPEEERKKTTTDKNSWNRFSTLTTTVENKRLPEEEEKKTPIEENPWNRFSTLRKLIRVTSFCRRFIKKSEECQLQIGNKIAFKIRFNATLIILKK